MKRKIIVIDKDKCNGCGHCVSACAEGALQIVDGKAKLISEIYCDGLGACIGKCPQDAIRIEEREAKAFDEEAVKTKSMKNTGNEMAGHKHDTGCPGMRSFSIKREKSAECVSHHEKSVSELTQWPVQLHLVPVNAPYWDGAELLLSADCVPFAYAGFHSELLKGKKVINACPKLDDTAPYLGKLTAILKENNIKSVTVAHMEVPCCSGIVRLAENALENCGRKIPFHTIKIGINGKVLNGNSQEAEI
ncbi:MAG: hypothetical protein A2017_06005 [Lentisphaerae bacterium GWF2_44_16]|nr:MAG: hypothetical protein A2017_06005 [Lentisphaerae bacterium GWF2_44_16]